MMLIAITIIVCIGFLTGYGIWAQEKIRRLKAEIESLTTAGIVVDGILFEETKVGKNHPIFLLLGFESETDKNIFMTFHIPDAEYKHNILGIGYSFKNSKA